MSACASLCFMHGYYVHTEIVIHTQSCVRVAMYAHNSCLLMLCTTQGTLKNSVVLQVILHTLSPNVNAPKLKKKAHTHACTHTSQENWDSVF